MSQQMALPADITEAVAHSLSIQNCFQNQIREGNSSETILRAARDQIDVLRAMANCCETSKWINLMARKHQRQVMRLSETNISTGLRRILVRLQDTSAGAYRGMCRWMCLADGPKDKQDVDLFVSDSRRPKDR